MRVLAVLCLFVGAALAQSDYVRSCVDKPDSGICLAYFPMFYYDGETDTCKEFVYGGCRGNGNRYSTKEECLKTCKGDTQKTEDVCGLDPDEGMCRGYFPMYYFDKDAGKCIEMIYGGCGGNGNRFATIEQCDEKCNPTEVPEKRSVSLEVCSLEYETGPCRAYIPRYYYDIKSGECKFFVYGGCDGNENSFEDVEECKNACGVYTQKAQDVCSLDSDVGKCRGYFPKYYFDKDLGKCVEMIYGGCGGNENRFDTFEQCDEKCNPTETPEKRSVSLEVCSLEYETGPCRAYMPRYYYDIKSGECKFFVYGGCRGNENSFANVEECKNACGGYTQKAEDVCSLEPEEGMCRGYFPMYYFDKDAGKCLEMIYGGCGGNGNRFATIEECDEKCNPTEIPEKRSVSLEVCSLEHETGPCRAYIPRYYYDAKSGECKFFVYGGCHGNGNSFADVEECKNACGGQSAPVSREFCGLEHETGPCKASIPRYYYDAKSGECKSFTYGGCRGNENNFHNVEECNNACSGYTADDVCTLAPDAGLCYGYFPMYYYDSDSGKCKEMVYGGCQGNGNRFKTMEACYAKCTPLQSATKHVSKEVCSQEPETGPCRARFPKYYFDAKSGECKRFIYGGCSGNDNRFDSKEECNGACNVAHSILKNCSDEPKTGPCRGRFPRYYFDKEAGECQEFIYGGCGGNGNNYATKDGCVDACS